MEEQVIFYPGDIVRVLDQIDLESTVIATVKGIEEDDEFRGLFYLYLVANNETLNNKFEPKIGYYWDIITNNSPYITLLSRATD